MPNWVFNSLTVQKKDLNKILDNEGQVDFNVLIPMPKELRDTLSGGRISECMEYAYLKNHTINEYRNKYREKIRSKEARLSELLDRIGDNPSMYSSEFSDYEEREVDGVVQKFQKKHNHTAEEIGNYYLSLDEKFGTHDWYKWSIQNWGCKWNACESYVPKGYENFSDDSPVTVSFDTPWGTPFEWLQTLADNGIAFHLAWEEEQGYRGIILSDGNGRENLEEEDLPMIEYEENEDGDFEQVEDEYGEDWTEYRLEDIFGGKDEERGI